MSVSSASSSPPHLSIYHTECSKLDHALVSHQGVRGEIHSSLHNFFAALKACSNSKDLDAAMQIHAAMVRKGCELDIHLGTMLQNVYVKCGSLANARVIFERLPHRSVVSWNIMIMAYAQMEEGDIALKLYIRMQQEGVVPDDRTFVAALKACSSLGKHEMGNSHDPRKRCWKQIRAIHSDILKRGLHSAPFVGTMLVDAYAKCGRLLDARSVFERMPHRTVVTWNAMIYGYAQMEENDRALQLYAQMRQEGMVPNERTFTGALKACSSMAALTEVGTTLVKNRFLEYVKTIHVDILNRGLESDIYVGSMLVDAYAKCGNLDKARHVFETMPRRTVVSWTAMIFGYAQMGKGEVGVELYARMRNEGVAPNHRTFVAALKACSSLTALGERDKAARKFTLELVRSIHLDVVKSGFETDLFVGAMLVDVYAKCGSLVDAKHVFERIPERNVVSWTSMISGYAQMGQGEAALKLYAQMQEEGIVPNDRTFVGALQACACLAGLDKGKEIHAQISKVGLDPSNPFLANTLIDMYGRCGSMEDAQHVFESLPTKTTVTWNALIQGYARQSESGLAFTALQRMKQEGVQPNSVTFLSILAVCSHAGLLNKGQGYFQSMTKEHGILPTIDHYTCTIDLLGRAGHLDKAVEVVNSMPFQPDAVVWETVLSACRKYTNIELGQQAFESAVSLDRHHGVAYVLMSSIYVAAQMWDNVKEIEERRGRNQAWKSPGQSWWTDAGGTANVFLVGDRKHPDGGHVYALLEGLFLKAEEDGQALPAEAT